MSRADLDLCQARIAHLRADGTDRCRRHATHEHHAHDTGTRVELCTQHLKALVSRERHGSSAHLLDLWLQRAA